MSKVTETNLNELHLFLAHKIDRAKLEKEIRGNAGGKNTVNF